MRPERYSFFEYAGMFGKGYLLRKCRKVNRENREGRPKAAFSMSGGFR